MNIICQTVGIDVSKDELMVYFECLDNHLQAKKLGRRKFHNSPKGYQARAWRPINKSMRRLREYVRERQAIKQLKTQAQNRLHAQRNGRHQELRTVKRLEQQIRLFERQLQQIEQDITKMRVKDEQLDQQVQLLCTIPHIGVITACVILAETNGFNLFESRSQLIKYAGLDIVEKQSGASLYGKARISKKGNANLRTAPFMSAIGLVNSQTVFGETYQRNLAKHGKGRKATMAVVRQLLKVAYGVFKSQRSYDEEIHRLRLQKEIGEQKVRLQ